MPSPAAVSAFITALTKSPTSVDRRIAEAMVMRCGRQVASALVYAAVRRGLRSIVRHLWHYTPLDSFDVYEAAAQHSPHKTVPLLLALGVPLPTGDRLFHLLRRLASHPPFPAPVEGYSRRRLSLAGLIAN